MVVRIHNTSKWSLVKAGGVLELLGQGQRNVRLEVNCPAPTRLDLVYAGDKTVFLAVAEGHEVIEFVAEDDCYIMPTTDDDFWFFTNDGDQIAVENPHEVPFTKIADRRARNPELERMMFKMEQNVMRRLEAAAAERQALNDWNAQRDAEAASREAEAGGGEAGDTSTETEGQDTSPDTGTGVPDGS